jgi:hypothetical protein
LTVNLRLNGNRLNGKLVKNAIGNGWDLATYDGSTYVGNFPGTANDVTITATLDSNGRVLSGTITNDISPSRGGLRGSQTYTISEGQLSADRKSFSGSLAVNGFTLGSFTFSQP